MSFGKKKFWFVRSYPFLRYLLNAPDIGNVRRFHTKSQGLKAFKSSLWDKMQIPSTLTCTRNLNIIFTIRFFSGDICFTFQFLEDQKLKQERNCEFWEKSSDLSDLTPFYGICLTHQISVMWEDLTQNPKVWKLLKALFGTKWPSTLTCTRNLNIIFTIRYVSY